MMHNKTNWAVLLLGNVFLWPAIHPSLPTGWNPKILPDTKACGVRTWTERQRDSAACAGCLYTYTRISEGKRQSHLFLFFFCWTERRFVCDGSVIPSAESVLTLDWSGTCACSHDFTAKGHNAPVSVTDYCSSTAPLWITVSTKMFKQM